MPQSYKIFVRDIPLLISDTLDVPKGYHAAKNEFLDTLPDFLKANYRKLNPDPAGIFMNADDPRKLFDNLKSRLTVVRSAGGVVWNIDRKILMIFRRGKWDLPKGKIEEGESVETAALREVEEESGVGMLRLLQEFDITYHIYEEAKKWVLKETHWYEMLSSDSGKTVPQKSEGITTAVWVSPEEMAPKLKNTYPSIRELMTKVLESGYFSGV